MSNMTSPIELVEVFLDGEQMLLEDIYVEISSEINKHISAKITGMIKAELYDNYVKQSNSNKNITIKHKIETKQTILYEGLIVFIEARAEGAAKENAVYFIEIEALSYTYLLDIELKNRSFQNQNMLYDDLVQKVLEDYENADCVLHAPQKYPQSIFVLQYMDTDWDFLIREISKFEEGLYADATMSRPRFHKGRPVGINRGELEQYNYTISKNVNQYRQKNYNIWEHEINELDFIEYEIFDAYTKETFQLGDLVNYQKTNLYVYNIFTEIKNNKLYNTYKLTTPNGLKMPRLANDDIQGLSIPGKVIAVEKNKLKLHLEIDQEQSIDTAYWFDYAAFYATWYGMPEINDIVNLHFPTPDEVDCIGINSFKQNPSGGYKRNNQKNIAANTSAENNKGSIDFEKSASDPNVKLLTTKAGRMIELGPDRICIQYSDDTYIILHDANGIELFTNKDIAIYAQGEVNIDAEERVHIQANEQISLQSQSSVIDITPSAVTVMAKEKNIY